MFTFLEKQEIVTDHTSQEVTETSLFTAPSQTPIPRTVLQYSWTYFVLDLFLFRLDALALSVIATATWLAGWLALCHSRYCIKTTKPIRKLIGPSGRSII